MMDKQPPIKLDYFTRTILLPGGEDGSPRSFQVAGYGARFFAGLTDFCIQAAAFAGIAWAAVRYRPDLFPAESWAWVAPVGFLEWHVIYMMLFEAFSGGLTPGKALLNLRVVRTNGERPGPVSLVLRNVVRLADIAIGAYLGSMIFVNRTAFRQRIGDLLGGTAVVYAMPLARQLERSDVPESIYSTSEDGYLLEAWIHREAGLDEESRLASAMDLCAYLQGKYGDAAEESVDPVAWLRQLYEEERQHPDPAQPHRQDADNQAN